MKSLIKISTLFSILFLTNTYLFGSQSQNEPLLLDPSTYPELMSRLSGDKRTVSQYANYLESLAYHYRKEFDAAPGTVNANPGTLQNLLRVIITLIDELTRLSNDKNVQLTSQQKQRIIQATQYARDQVYGRG